MSTPSKRKAFDALVSRILFLELGALAALVTLYTVIKNPVTEPLTITFITGFLLIGLFCFYIYFGFDDKKVKKWANQTGNHWLMFVFVLLAYGLANVIRRWK